MVNGTQSSFHSFAVSCIVIIALYTLLNYCSFVQVFRFHSLYIYSECELLARDFLVSSWCCCLEVCFASGHLIVLVNTSEPRIFIVHSDLWLLEKIVRWCTGAFSLLLFRLIGRLKAEWIINCCWAIISNYIQTIFFLLYWLWWMIISCRCRTSET